MCSLAAKSLDRQVERGRIEQADADTVFARVSATDALSALADCDLVIESVVEDLAVKRGLFAELDGICKEGAILATNTSTLPIVEMAVATSRPDKVVGIHFFNPAPAMALVEIIAPLTASQETVDTALEFAKNCGKDAVAVKDRAGFRSSRALWNPLLGVADTPRLISMAHRPYFPGKPKRRSISAPAEVR